MTTLPSFPSLPGLAFPVAKAPLWSTRVASHVSGREVRNQLHAQALYEFTLSFDGLDSSASNRGLGQQSLQALMGFFLECQGQAGTFLYTDPTDGVLTGQTIGIGDGTTTQFTFCRTLGAFTEYVPWVAQIHAVYLNGTVQSAATWGGTYPNMLTFSSAPPTGAVVTADFTFAFLCRFLSDSQDFEQFMSNYWEAASIKFRSVKDEAPIGGVIPVV